MPAYKPYLKLTPQRRRKLRKRETGDGEYFFSEDVADSPCDAGFYIIPHSTEPMFKVGWCIAADRRFDTINEIWGNQLDIYDALVIATSREAAIYLETSMKLVLARQGWQIHGLPPLEGYTEFFSTDGLVKAFETCTSLLPFIGSLEKNTHVIRARGVDEPVEHRFERIARDRAGKRVSPDNLLERIVQSQMPLVEIPRVIGSMTWDAFPKSIIAIFSKAFRASYGPYAPYANDLWIKFGTRLLQPENFLDVALPYRTEADDDLLSLLAFIESQQVVIRSQDGEWITEILGALSAKAMVAFVESRHIDLRALTFAQRAKALKKVLQHKDQAGMLECIADQLDDLDQLQAEADDRCKLSRHFSGIGMLLNNPSHIEQGNTPKNFPGVLARIYFSHFDGLTDDTIIHPSRWPAHEQLHRDMFKKVLNHFKDSTRNTDGNHLFRPAPVFQKAVLVAMLDLYGPCLQDGDANSRILMDELSESGHAEFAAYFDEDKSKVFRLVRDELRQSRQRLVAVRNGALPVADKAALRTSVEALATHLPHTEEGRYFAMYAFEDLVAEFQECIPPSNDQTDEERRSPVLGYLRGLWSLVYEDIVHHHHIFNHLLLYLDAWSARLELDGVPAAHPQAVL